MMRLGKDAMFRQQDMDFADALELLRAQLTLAFGTEDMHEGVAAFFEKRDPSGTAASGRHAWPMRSLVEDLHAQRERIKLGGGEEKIASPARRREAHRARAAGAADRRGHVGRARHPRPAALLSGRDGGP